MRNDLRFGVEQDDKMPKKILVIVDKIGLRKDIVEMLGFEGYVADWSDNSIDGLQKVYSFAPSLILCNTNPPQVDSYAILKQIKNDPALADMPVIIFTSKVATLDD